MRVKAICDICSKPLNEERIKLKIKHTRRYKLFARYEGETYTTRCKYDLCYDCFSKMVDSARKENK